MVNIGYHKGQVCVLSSSLCQEGYCANCMIFLEKLYCEATSAAVSIGKKIQESSPLYAAPVLSNS